MRTTRTVDYLEGTNESPASGDFIISSERDFVNRGVTAAASVLYNQSTGDYATVTAVTATRVDATGCAFKPGDFFQVSLPTAWTVQTDDGPVINVDCNICGFSYPNKEMNRGVCKTCQDKPRSK